MAIQWGAWEGSSPNRIRVGIDVDWGQASGGSINHDTQTARATVRYYTDVEGNWSDSQTLNFSGTIDGSVSFTNSQSNNQVLRATRTYDYDYPSSSYGSSPGSRTFSANLTGAFNGATPSKSVTSNIPARPYDPPLIPTNVSVSRVSETSAKISWTNRDTAGEPWSAVRVQVDVAANAVWNGDVGTTGGGGTSITHTGLSSNQTYQWRVRSEGPGGTSAWQPTSGVFYTDPIPSTNVSRAAGTGAQQVVSWTNATTTQMSYVTEIHVTRDGGVNWAYLAEVGNTVTSYTDTAASAAQKTAYRTRVRTTGGTQGTLYSDWSNETTMTVGVTSPPNAPTGLAPANSLVVIPTQPKTFTWQHNSTDTTPQSAYQIQWRVVGGASWTILGKTSSPTSSATLAAGTFPDNSTIEWQVRTWGSATTGGSDGTGASAWSASAVFKTVGDPNAARALKRVMRLDLETGEMETAPVMSLPPIGSIMAFAGQAAPQGWLLCQGQSLLRNDYPDLFAVINTTFGAVDSTRFSLPDMRDRNPIGASATRVLGAKAGSTTVTLAATNLPPHIHGMNHSHEAGSLTISKRAGTGSAAGAAVGNSTVIGDTNVAGSTAGPSTPDTGTGSDKGLNSTPVNIENPYIAINYIIKI